MAMEPTLETLVAKPARIPRDLVLDIIGWIRAIQTKMLTEGSFQNRLILEKEIGAILVSYLQEEYRIMCKGPFPVDPYRYGAKTDQELADQLDKDLIEMDRQLEREANENQD